MEKQMYALLLLLIASLQLINTRIITVSDHLGDLPDLHQGLSEAQPGDTIELKSGFYRNYSYILKSGLYGKPIKIKSAPNAQVYFLNDWDVPDEICFFEGENIQHVTIEGPMIFQDASCAFKLINSSYIKITNVSIYNMRQQAIIMSGFSNVITENVIQGCVLENRETAKRKTSGWNQCLAIWGLPNGQFSSHITISRNNISNSYGEAVYFLNCRYCRAVENNITNGLFANIYIDSSTDIDITKNVLRVNSIEYNNKNGKACGIAMSPDAYNSIERIRIENNIIIGTRIGIYFFTQHTGGTYNKVKIYFNTLWNVDYTPLLFKHDQNYTNESETFGCEMKNNFIYFAGAVEFEPKEAWKFASNYFYGTWNVPYIYRDYYDNTSKADSNLTFDSLFNQISGCENYYDPNLNPECLRPSPEPGSMQLYHSGTSLGYQNYSDIYSCTRSAYNPSVGAYEFPHGCTEEVEPQNITRIYHVTFNITYCTSGYRTLKIMGSYCNWNAAQCVTMNKQKNCVWTDTFYNGTSLNFKYKFAEAIQTSLYKIESDPFRTFDGEYLSYIATNNGTGRYEDCDFETIGDRIILYCSWR